MPKLLATCLSLLAGMALVALYALGDRAWPIGFVVLLPWLHELDRRPGVAATLRWAWLMTIAFSAAGFAWFGFAIGRCAQIGEAGGLLVLLLLAPLFQPQLLVFALARQLARRRFGAAIGACAGAAAWVGTEWLIPKLLGDTLGHGLYPSTLLRQAADLGGAAGLTLLLLLVNEALQVALSRRARRPLLVALLPPLLLAGYGWTRLQVEPAGPPLRIGLVQADVRDLEALRREKGSHAAVRELLDLHFAMSYDAIEHQQADAVLWTETVYPTTFAQPKSAAGAEFDREIVANVNAAGVPFVFGTYDRDRAGEYNAAAFVVPGRGLQGFYRKTRLFPLTEFVPSWLDGPALRSALPWLGQWRPGNGARVFPLRTRDGREVPVLPLICRDDTDSSLAIDGARLGAQAILTMSNDAWFSEHPQGAQWHLAAAAFRSIETRLPQFRVTTNGLSGVIDARGEVVAGTRMNERALAIGALPVPVPPRTLMVAWGDWVGGAGLSFLLLLGAVALWPQVAAGLGGGRPSVVARPIDFVFVLPPAVRWLAALLRGSARLALVGLGLLLLNDEVLRTNTLAQLRAFALWVLAPEAAALCLLMAFRARLRFTDGCLVLLRGSQRLELALADIASVRPWRLALPGAGLSLTLVDGSRWPYQLSLSEPQALASALGKPWVTRSAYFDARWLMARGRLQQPLFKFLLLPLLLALPAFQLHQQIAYGSAFGEWISFGPKAYATGLLLWWAAWVLGVALLASGLRAAIEFGSLLGGTLRPAHALPIRRRLEQGGLATLYLGLPAWWIWRVLGT